MRKKLLIQPRTAE